ncbi:hypothetical protein [Novipirellula maiorica]|uniref:hypothetical protein n=1 Tax=Novipirellula maiorica TaxID=1265734 RepID=UPI001181BB80|nr:hypothetical protein [Rhodopirellula maiorica]
MDRSVFLDFGVTYQLDIWAIDERLGDRLSSRGAMGAVHSAGVNAEMAAFGPSVICNHQLITSTGVLHVFFDPIEKTNRYKNAPVRASGADLCGIHGVSDERRPLAGHSLVDLVLAHADNDFDY